MPSWCLAKKIYHSVREHLKGHQFADTRENAFVMISPQSIQVDLLPFGEIAIDDSVKIIGQGMTSIHVNGFMEVYQGGTSEVKMETGHVFKTATLPAIVLLKLIAYDDRPEQRQKDAGDIAGIIQNYFHLQSDLIFENHIDLFSIDKPEKELHEIAAIVIGREITKMCGDNQKLKNRLENIITNQIEKGHASAFIQEMVRETKQPVNDVIEWLKHLISGLTEN